MSAPNEPKVESRIVISVNGEPRDISAGINITELLAELEHDPRAVAIECNGDILPRSSFAKTVLEPGDRLEVVHFVQGG